MISNGSLMMFSLAHTPATHLLSGFWKPAGRSPVIVRLSYCCLCKGIFSAGSRGLETVVSKEVSYPLHSTQLLHRRLPNAVR
jgi:hypothetical protein